MTKLWTAWVGLLLTASLAFAEPLYPFRDQPPEVQAKMQRLTEILAQSIKEGRLSDAQIRSQLNGGDAPAMIRSLGPEAATLLQEITEAFKGKYTEDELSAILGGLLETK